MGAFLVLFDHPQGPCSPWLHSYLPSKCSSHVQPAQEGAPGALALWAVCGPRLDRGAAGARMLVPAVAGPRGRPLGMAGPALLPLQLEQAGS